MSRSGSTSSGRAPAVDLRALCTWALGLVVLACGSPGLTPLVLPQTDSALPDTPRNLPTHLDSGASPLAQRRVTLRMERECLVGLDSMGETLWLIWPSAYWLDGEVVMNGRTAVARIGDRIQVTGGSNAFMNIQENLTNEGPPSCRHLSLFWVGGVSNA